MKEKTYLFRAKCCYILAIIVLIISLPSLFIGCDSDLFELETDIYPEIELVDTGSGKTISVQYNLGDLLILDTWSNIDASKQLYLIQKRKVEEPVHLKVVSGDWKGTKFYYNIASISKKTEPAKHDLLMKHVESFPNVIWKYKGNVHLNEKKEDIELKPDKANPKTDKLEAL